jgi:NAD(P)-dependent dehydrogenase (short-subunit alcohol dehydrogenase family)
MKAAMITGGTSGIGLAIAKGLLEKQYKPGFPI